MLQRLSRKLGQLRVQPLLHRANRATLRAIEARQFGRALAESQLAESLVRTHWGADGVEYGTVLQTQAFIHAHAGQRDDAKALYRQSLDLLRTRVAPAHPLIINAREALMQIARAENDWQALSELLRQQVASIPGGPRRPEELGLLNTLAEVLELAGDPEDAIRVLRQHVELAEKENDFDSLAGGLTKLAVALLQADELGEALRVGEEALEVATRERLVGPRRTGALTALGWIYSAIRDFRKVVDAQREAIAIWSEMSPEEKGLQPLGEAYALVNYGVTLTEHTETEGEGIKILESAENILRNIEPTPEHIEEIAFAKFMLRANLAEAYREAGRLSDAEALALELLGNPAPFASLHWPSYTLGRICYDTDRFADAESYYRQALKGAESKNVSPGPRVRYTGRLALAIAAQGRIRDAYELSVEAMKAEDAYAVAVANMASEWQKLQHAKRGVGSMGATLTLAATYGLEHPDVVRTAFELVVRRKGMALETMAARRDELWSSDEPRVKAAVHEFKRLRTIVASSQTAEFRLSPDEKRLSTAFEEFERADRELSELVPERALQRRLLNIHYDGIISAMPAGSVLIDYVQVWPIALRGGAATVAWNPDRPRYLAFALRPDDPQPLRATDLGEIAVIDRSVEQLQRTIAGTTPVRVSGLGLRRHPATSLYEYLLSPFRDLIRGASHVFICPDGNLGNVPFELLRDEDGVLFGQLLSISYLNGARDLLRFDTPSSQGLSAAVVIADPHLDLAAEDGVTTRATQRVVSESITPPRLFQRLRAARAEGIRVAELLAVEPFLDGAAVKSVVLSSTSPAVLHLASHGLYQTSGGDDAEAFHERGFDRDNPLFRCWIAMAGANTWLRGNSPSPQAGNGILNAFELSGCDLRGTRLVVLSACDSALGDAQALEGAIGLRRAVLMAGTRAAIVGMWRVPDTETGMLMERFYTHFSKGVTAGESLRRAKDEMMHAAAPSAWAGFVLFGDPTVTHVPRSAELRVAASH